MELPTPPATARAVRALAAFVRERLGEVTDTLSPLWNRRDADVALLAGEDHLVAATARQFATVIAGAAAPFAPTSYARARLIRQMHASGLLTDGEARRTVAVMAEVDDRPDAAKARAATGTDARAATGTDARGVPRPMPRPRR